MRASAELGAWGEETGVRACLAKHDPNGGVIVPRANGAQLPHLHEAVGQLARDTPDILELREVGRAHQRAILVRVHGHAG